MSPKLARLLILGAAVKVAGHVASAVIALNMKRNAPPRPAPGADEIGLVTIMGGERFASTAAAFRGGRVVCWYGGTDLDLREATIDPGGARLDVRTVFGGTRIVVAPGVPVVVRGWAVLGGAGNLTGAPAPTPGAPGLAVTALTLFGGMQVIAAKRGDEIPGWA